MPRAGLTRDRVVAAAEDYVDEVGWEQLNLSALATRLGVRQPSLYKHTEGLDELRLRIAIRAGREITEVMGRAAVGLAGRDALVAMCRAYRTWAKAHPGRYASCQRAGQPGDEWETVARAWLQVSLDVLAGFDLTGDDAIDALRALRSALHGFVSLEALGGFGIPVDVDRSFDRMVAAFADSLTSWTVTARA
jgi:AcrR family transcriptional regulator